MWICTIVVLEERIAIVFMEVYNIIEKQTRQNENRIELY